MKNLIKVLGLIIPLTITGCSKPEQRKFLEGEKTIEVYNPYTNRIATYRETRTKPILGIFSSIGYIKVKEIEAPENYHKEQLNQSQDLASK
jgi:hypothetical protein